MTRAVTRRVDDELQPIRLPGFTLGETGVDVIGEPTLAEFQGALGFAQRAHKCSGWWIADLLAYGEKRTDWGERLSQVIETTGYSPSYVQNLKNLGENIKRPHRSREVQFSQHFLVEKLSSKEQVIWLAKSAEGKWSNRELRQAIQQAHSPTVAEGQAETLHTVDVTVEMTVEASTAYAGEQEAWELVKAAIKRDEQDGLMPKANRARVIASRARPK